MIRSCFWRVEQKRGISGWSLSFGTMIRTSWEPPGLVHPCKAVAASHSQQQIPAMEHCRVWAPIPPGAEDRVQPGTVGECQPRAQFGRKSQLLEHHVFSLQVFFFPLDNFQIAIVSLCAGCSGFHACSATYAMSGEVVDVELIKEWKEEKEQLWQPDSKMPV